MRIACHRRVTLHPLDLLLALLGVAVGAFGTLVGAGGGFILVPVLLLIYPDREPDQIVAISLMVVFANSLSGTLAYARQGRVDWRSAGWFALATFPGALGGALVTSFIPRRVFDAGFGVLLMSLGLYLAIRKMRQDIIPPVTGWSVVQRDIRDREGLRYIYSYHMWKGMVASAAIGFLSSLLGIGGGVIHVPVMATTLHFPVHIAAATSHAVLAFMSGEGTIVHFATGTLTWDRSLFQASMLAIGAVVGAQIGARAARKLHGNLILRALAFALMLLGLRLLLKAAGI